MFEDSVFSSGCRAQSVRSRWATVAAVGVQVFVVGLVWVVPLFRPEMLPVVSAAPEMVTLWKPPVKIKAKPQVVRDANAVASPSHAASESAPEVLVARGGGSLGGIAAGPGGDAPVSFGSGPGMGGGSNPLGVLGSGGSSPSVVPVRSGGETKERLKVSSGVVAGLLLRPIVPVYPAIAKSAHVDGTVVVTATIDRQGRIVGLQVVSGPAMLRNAAEDAVKQARYRPYLLNGEATEVETTISVNFRLGD